MYKDIVVCINEADGRDNTIRAAARFAKDIKANLTGLYVRVGDLPAVGPYGFISAEIARDIQKTEDDRAAKAKEAFETITSGLTKDANWLEVAESQHPLRAIAYADLVITNQVAYDPRQGRSNMSFVNNLILETGKPVVLIPKGWDEPSFGSNIVLGWNESREASRAVQDSMPLLEQANHVEAICVNYKGEDEPFDVSEISSYLSRRDVSNSFRLAETDDHLDSPEKVLHARAVKYSADLIVVGGYGHTRLREIILGGVTRFLTKHSTVPVLFSH
ncbi:MAG: nucleotide-binding universal stress UspA family protein [Arenicella sp.]|jgi:nucleotide-binding universal stress UspA family protein